MKLVSPYRQSGVWLKGSLHNHTTISECHHPLTTVYRMYSVYDMLAISDHNLVTPHAEESNIPTLFEAVEVSSPECHMLLVHLPEHLMDHFSYDFSVEHYDHLSAACIAHGGFSVLVHSNRVYSQDWKLEYMLAMKSYTGIEVINGDGSPQYDIAFERWDAVLPHGCRVLGFGKFVTLIGKHGEVLYEQAGRFNELTYTCRGNEGYVRIAAYLEGGFGAFSQPIFIEQGADEVVF
ncbi:hypothetical protein FHS16_006020 [Paenibacillus endophyticus]|uniref:Phosphoesterase n=1 Tax=Paenibacillus endophyticus TaxID=1294268 RepID=A0A7W5GCZ0_9BACL|nr:phosphoesterase [Paenibacillus endophyticus]MBB3155904.1 hypothetical protein [Paenibacillus endophyticus]